MSNKVLALSTSPRDKILIQAEALLPERPYRIAKTINGQHPLISTLRIK